MSTAALAIQPLPLIRQLNAGAYSSGAGTDQETVRNRARALHDQYVDSTVLTYREALVSSRFHELAEQWHDAMRFESSLSEIAGHPAYQAIIALGDEAVPLILRELHRRPAPWFAALKAITGFDAVTPAQRGDMQAMADIWIQWGRQRRLI